MHVVTFQCVSMTPGRLPHTFGKEETRMQCNGGTTFVDHASGCVHIHNQVSLGSGDALQGKHAFEQFANVCGIKFKSFHADNHLFGSAETLKDPEVQDQSIAFSGVGAHFQNGVSKRAIQTVTSWALCFMMHQLIHWPEQFDETLWPFAMEHAVTIWNHLP